MHHPGPPLFVTVGGAVDLAPRDPEPAATYRWTVERSPPDSTARLSDRPVQEFRPDAAGSYRLSLSAPDGVHQLTVRCFPETPGGKSPPDGVGTSGGLGRAAGAEDRQRAYAQTPAGRGDQTEAGRPRLRLAGRTEGSTAVVEAHPRPHPDGSRSAAGLDVEFVLDDRDETRREQVTVSGRQLRVPAEAVTDRSRVHAVAVGPGGHSVPDAVEIRREDGLTVANRHAPPRWALDAVYYEVYVRTFAPEAPVGERLAGIADRLDYLADLGVDALWLTPVLEHDGAPHGYNITDFFSVAADLGDRADYRRLVERAHSRDIRVLFDLVLNHSARDHPYFRSAVEGGQYRDWYEWRSAGQPETHFGWEHVANFDFDSLAVRRHLLDVIEEWAPLVDGFRCDMAWAVPEGFWREVRDRVKAIDPEFLLLDETIPYVPEFHGLFDVHFDSTTYATTRSVGSGWAPAEAVLEAVAERRAVGFPDHAGFLLYTENHDETRYLVDCGRSAAFAAAGVLCTLPGAPLVYAGQELGQRGRRDDIVWETTDTELATHYRRLLSLRSSMPALGADAALHAIEYELQDGDPDRVVAYGRAATTADTTEGAAAVVVCNFGETAATVAVGPAVSTVDAVTDEEVGTGSVVRVEDVVVLPTDPDEVG